MTRSILRGLVVAAAFGATEASGHGPEEFEPDISAQWAEGAERYQVRACHADVEGKAQLFYFIEETRPADTGTATALRAAGFRWLDEDGMDGERGCNGVYDDKNILHFGRYDGGFAVSPICESGRRAIEARVKPVRFLGLKGKDIVAMAKSNDCGSFSANPHPH